MSVSAPEFLNQEAWEGSIFSSGWREGGGGAAPAVEPATGEELGRFGLADGGDLSRAVAAAAAAQLEWATTSYEERAAVLRRAGGLWERHAQEVESWIVREAGSIPPKAGTETHTAAQECYEAATLPSQPPGAVLATTFPQLSIGRRVPAGVIGVISPFNFPLILAIRSVAPALALGNAVILKPDPRTTVCGGFSIARVFEEAGLPDGLLHVLPGGGEIGAALVEEPAVRVISFTGSTAAGRKVGEAAGRLLKRAHLELGGNSALIVLEGADLERAVSAAAWGSFLHQGQICMTTGRHLVQESIAEAYEERLAEKAAQLRVGNPASEEVALGPIIDEGQLARIDNLVTASAEGGATVLAGGTHEGLFYRPTVITGVEPSTPAWAEEVFGPVAPVMRFGDVEELVAIARDTPYGLSLGILGADPIEALELSSRIPSGIVHINDQTVLDEPPAPFGGVGASGTGARFGGAAASIEAFTEAQWVTIRGEVAEYPF